MSWPFLAVFFSGWLFVDASYRGPRWQRWVFKPVTLLLLLLLAWQAPVLSAAGYLIVLGLLATLIGDALLLLPRERYCTPSAPFPLPPAVYPELRQPDDVQSVLAAAAGAAGDRRVAAGHPWTRLEEMRWPIVTYVAMTLLMVWLAGEQYFLRSTDFGFSLLTGTSLLLLANVVWLINRYRFTFRAADAIVAFCYFSGHFLIVRSLYL